MAGGAGNNEAVRVAQMKIMSLFTGVRVAIQFIACLNTFMTAHALSVHIHYSGQPVGSYQAAMAINPGTCPSGIIVSCRPVTY